MHRISLLGLAYIFLAGSLADAAPPVSALGYSPDGRTLVAGSYRKLQLIDGAGHAVLAAVAAGDQRITAAEYSPDGKYLAIASGEPSKSGRIQLFDAKNPAKPLRDWVAHKDLIYSLKFQPKGTLLASAGYDRVIRLWNREDGKPSAELKDHSDTIYGLDFHPDGQLLASCSADRAVKIWEIATGKRLYSLNDSTDWLYAVAWHPDGKRLAAAGVDKSIRVWNLDRDGGKIAKSVFGDTEPINRLIYSSDGKHLLASGESPRAKLWNADGMVEETVLPAQDSTILSLAYRPDGGEVAIGTFAGAIGFFDAKSGKAVAALTSEAQPPAKPKPAAKTMAPTAAAILKLSPAQGMLGKKIAVEVDATNIQRIDKVEYDRPGLTVKVSEGPAGRNALEIAIDAGCEPGPVELKFKAKEIVVGRATFLIDRYPLTVESDGQHSYRTGTLAALPATFAGSLDKAGDVDFFRFRAKKGDQVGVQASIDPAAKNYEPVLEWIDPHGRVIGESGTSLLAMKIPEDGPYAVSIRDKEFRGGAGYGYRLSVGPIPIVTGVFPLGVARGSSRKIELVGVNLGTTSVTVDVPADAKVGSTLPVSLPNVRKALGSPKVVVGEFSKSDGAVARPAPETFDGRIAKPGETVTHSFLARKGEPLLVETEARRLGSELDSVIEILDSAGRLLPRATLRCTAKTFTTFRDNDSVTPNMRLEYWNELAMRDHIYVGNQLLKIFELPIHPDADCPFYAVGGQRLAYLGTSPAHVANNSPMYKVEIHPPGTVFPPNGLPVFTLHYRNDDGGPGYCKDSRLYFEPPADGEYRVRVGDSRSQGSERHAYRLHVRPPRPDFSLKVAPAEPKVSRGESIPVTVTADRVDGYEGPIEIRAIDLPAGIRFPATVIEAEQLTATVSVSVDEAVKELPPILLEGTATIAGQKAVRTAPPVTFKVVEKGDIVTRVEAKAISIRPGERGKIVATIERRNDFKGRVPLEVRGLPYGVRVVDLGLNGILVNPGETCREIAIFCESWVEPAERPIVVLAKREGKGTEHAAESLILKIEPK